MVQRAVDGLMPFGLRVGPGGQIGGVGAQQVVEGVPAGCVLGDQVRVRQLVDQDPGPGRRERGEAGGCGGGDVRAGVQAEQPEHPCRSRTEILVGPGEHHPEAAGGIPGVQGVEAASFVAQGSGQRGERMTRPGGGTRGGDVQGQRQPGRQRYELGHGLRLGAGPATTQTAGQQVAGLVGEHAHVEQTGPVGGRQASPARHPIIGQRGPISQPAARLPGAGAGSRNHPDRRWVRAVWVTGQSGLPGSLGYRAVWVTGQSGLPGSLGYRAVWVTGGTQGKRS
jgi:hypothetical protein